MLDMPHETSSAACILAVSMQYMSLLIMLAMVLVPPAEGVSQCPDPGLFLWPLITFRWWAAHTPCWVLPCRAGDCEEGEHFNLHFWIHERSNGRSCDGAAAAAASTTTKYFIWSRAARQLSTICKTVIKCKTTIKCFQWRRFEEGFSKYSFLLRPELHFVTIKWKYNPRTSSTKQHQHSSWPRQSSWSLITLSPGFRAWSWSSIWMEGGSQYCFISSHAAPSCRRRGT